MSKELRIVGIRGTSAVMPEVAPSRLEFDKSYVCVTEYFDDDGESQVRRELCCVLKSGQQNDAVTLEHTNVIAGQEVAVKTKSERGPLKAIWFMSQVQQSQRVFTLSQLGKCSFFGPIQCEFSGE